MILSNAINFKARLINIHTQLYSLRNNMERNEIEGELKHQRSKLLKLKETLFLSALINSIHAYILKPYILQTQMFISLLQLL